MLLLIPGPVTTHDAVREAAARDYAPWDNDFRAIVRRIRDRVLAIAGGREGEHAALLLQGCGHFAMEAACRTFVPQGGRILLPKTGHYADRIERLATEAGRVVVPMPVPAGQRRSIPAALRAALAAHPGATHVALVYSETSTGVVHDAPALAEVAGRGGAAGDRGRDLRVRRAAVRYRPMPMVDSMAFTSNKCIEGLPGVAFIIARVDRLVASAGQARSWTLT